ncbi:MAG: response regulator [Candidatus Nitrohelix vancouverensis]|uniref:histidine kinase n=1 Tax=Candidatus Nitrohelix vancouverensis TaxID=2705534 RepID=A0A7T0C126_9BACT|nr:MAG: response regulator [Candidatus Nitrohelix vancouverensis]
MPDKPLKILLVEDNEDDIFLFHEMIREENPVPLPSIETCPTAEEAIEKLAGATFDLCLFDYHLGETDGVELIRRVRSQWANLPLILLTGHGDQEIAVQAMKAGANDYLNKDKLSGSALINSFRYCLKIAHEGEMRLLAENQLKQSHDDLQESLRKLQSAQTQILRSEKLAGIGRLAAGVCHEILNPLNIISGHSQALLMERKNDPVLADDLKSIMEEVHRIEKIISSLLKLSRKQDVELKKEKINVVLESVLSVMEKDLHLQSINVEKQLALKLPDILIDTDQMRQVFLNLINNAKYSMPNGGTLTVSTSMHTKDRRIFKRDEFKLNNPNTLRIQFKDTGYGIEESDLEKLFEPFFTTKPEDQGTGLGLSICHSIIEKHGGSIEAENLPQRGANFTIDLPIVNNRLGTIGTKLPIRRT